jgi:thiol-disulfide isomerase/thioredoxin
MHMMKLISYCACILMLCPSLVSLPLEAFGTQGLEKAPLFELSDLQGKPHRLADYAGRVVVINFWASWCPECIDEMPSLNGLYEKLKGKGLVVLGITSDRKKEPVEKALMPVPVSYPILLETTGKVFIRQYTVIGLPTTVVVDRDGAIVERLVGKTDFGAPAFERKIQDLLDVRRGR